MTRLFLAIGVLVLATLSVAAEKKSEGDALQESGLHLLRTPR